MNASRKDRSTEISKRKRRASVRGFASSRSILLVTHGGPLSIPGNAVSPDRVGWKAFGLNCLPSQWVPPFFVIESAATKEPDQNLQQQVSECLVELGIEGSVIVRSSGSSETIEQRGRLFSATCSSAEIVNTVRRLSKKLSEPDLSDVHWIVQKHTQPVRKGHLSNERRLAREARDFVAEFEIEGDRPGYTAPVAVRHWRDGEEVVNFDLSCTTEPGVTLKLKRVALWATALSSRILFEWVWSGTEVWIVQADIAKSTHGVNPNQLRPPSIPAILPESLQLFRTASSIDFARYGKLKNARTYSEIGYRMPLFYVLDDADTIRAILSGNIPPLLERDLDELTQRPLIIRTDGMDIPQQKLVMLPRSDGLPTTTEAKQWLLERFRQEIQRIGISDLPLCLIAHHFIPSAAAAWARAEPSSAIVRVESLWGLPEGLYWHSHDTFEVDVSKADSAKSVRKRLRFKGTFIAPDASGRWIHHEALVPFDWGPSITSKEWLFEIARATKLVAGHDNHAVAVMWFIDNDPRATAHSVLPWYHAESAIGSPKAAPRRKLSMVSDFKIETTADWEELKTRVKAGKRVERIMLEPKDPELVRNQEFARELAAFAAANKIVVELAGGVLSHAYHILRREGAQVECIDLFGAEKENVEYNKLVRDKIPDFIEGKGETVEVVRLKGEALLAALRQKLVEESFEAMDAKSGDELIGELADVQEVIAGICEALQIPPDQVEAERIDKQKRRGGFHRGIMLRRTSTPHSLLTGQSDEDKNSAFPVDEHEDVAIEHPGGIPANRPYSRPDLRSVDQQLEGILTFETNLNRIGTAKHSTVFEIPIDQEEVRKFKLLVELTRNGSTLWSQVRLRLEPSQISMKLEQLDGSPGPSGTTEDSQK